MKIFDIELFPYQLLALSYALVVFSYPMPPQPGLIEAIMGVGLSVGCLLLARKYLTYSLWKAQSVLVSLLAATTLLTFPLVAGVAYGNAYGSIIRDLFPMLFLLVLIPLVSYSVLQSEATKVARITLGAILFVGVVSAGEFMSDATREFGSLHNMSAAFSYSPQIDLADNQTIIGEEQTGSNEKAPASASGKPQVVMGDEIPQHLPTDVTSSGRVISPNAFSVMALHLFEPAVLFTAIFFGCFAVTKLMSREFLQAAVCSVLAATAAYGMMALRMRAPSFLLAAMLLLFVAIILARSNAKTRVRIAAVGAIVASAVILFGWDAIASLIEKQMNVGLNGKNAELAAVIRAVTVDSWHFLFGYGWGAEFRPAYQPFPTRFTHSVISFVLLKTGLVGLAVFAAVYFQLMVNFVQSIKARSMELDQWAIVLAATATLAVGVALQPTYKMLGFSFVALLALVAVRRTHQTKT